MLARNNDPSTKIIDFVECPRCGHPARWSEDDLAEINKNRSTPVTFAYDDDLAFRPVVVERDYDGVHIVWWMTVCQNCGNIWASRVIRSNVAKEIETVPESKPTGPGKVTLPGTEQKIEEKDESEE